MKKLTIATASVLMLALAAPVLASNQGKENKSYATSNIEWMSVESITAKATELGYDVRKVERDDDYYEIDAFDKSGMKVEIKMHPTTGEILKVERDDDDSRSYAAGNVEWMSVDSARAKAAGLGYEVRKVKRDDDYYEIDAFDKSGMKVEIKMHPTTGKILKVERDDDNRK